MAIDDNKLYGLNGAQIKELPEKIEAVKGKAKVLTSDDYNWHGTGSVDNKIALWKLEPGLYTVDNSLNASDVLYSMGFSFGNDYTTFIIGNYDSEYLTVFALGYQMNANPNRVMMATQIRKTGQGYSQIRRILTDDVIVNNLTSAVNSYALSAAQGKVLKDLVDSLAIRGTGAPTTTTVGQVGTLYEDTTNGDLYICTDATNPYVWEEVGAGGGGPTVVQTTGTSTTDVMSQKAVTDAIAGAGGGITELTTADYNYPTDNPSCVAFWLLEPGIYSWSGDVAFRANSSWTDQTNSPGTGIIWDAGDGQLGMAFDFKGNGHWYQLANSTTGQSNWANRGLLNTDVYQGGNFNNVRIGYSTTSSGTRATAIGRSASATATDAIVIGTSANTSSTSATDAIVIGNSATTGATRAIAIGKDTQSTASDGIVIGNNVKSGGIAIGRNIPLSSGIVIGNTAEAHGTSAVSIGTYANASAGRGIAIGESAEVTTGASFSVALGAGSKVTQQGEVSIGLVSGSTYGYNDSNYRLLTGLYDGQNDHDAATYGQVVSYAAINGAGAPTTATEGKYVGQLYYDTTNESMYFLKAIDTTTDPDTYTWEALGGGGGPSITTLTTADYNWNVSAKAAVEPYDSIAPWLLDIGNYRTGESVRFATSASSLDTVTYAADVIMELNTGGAGKKSLIILGRVAVTASGQPGGSMSCYGLVKRWSVSTGELDFSYALLSANNVNDLSGSGTNGVLAASTGKAIKDSVGDITTLTTTTKTSTVDAINELDSNIPAIFTTNEWNALWA